MRRPNGKDFAAVLSALYKACCWNSDLVAVTFVLLDYQEDNSMLCNLNNRLAEVGR